MKRPWMPLYIADYRTKTMRLSTVEHGAYLLLIMEYWHTGGLPDDDKQLARVVGLSLAQWRKIRPTIQGFFHDGWKHKRIEDEIAHAAEVSNKRKAAVQERENKRQSKDTSNDRSNDASDDDTLHTSQRKEDKTALGAASAKYAFEGGIIRLSHRHFTEWTQGYPNLDLRGELTARDAWLASDRATDEDRRNWFISTSKYLANRNMEARAKVTALRPEPRRGIEGIV